MHTYIYTYKYTHIRTHTCVHVCHMPHVITCVSIENIENMSS